MLAIILSSDKTLLSVGTGNQSLHPLYLSIGNIKAEIRCKQSYHAFVLIGLLPLPEFRNVKHTDVQSLLLARLHHYCLKFILKPLMEAAERGVLLQDPHGNFRRCYTPLSAYSVDIPEAQRLACVMANASPITLAKGGTLGDATPHPRRHGFLTVRCIREAIRHGGQRFGPWNRLRTFMQFCKDNYHLNGVHRPFFEGYRYSDPSQFFVPDALHALHREFYDHSFKWIKTALGPDLLDFRYAIMQPRVGLEHFNKKVSNLPQVTGRTYRDLHRYHVPVTDGLSRSVQKAISSLAKLRLLAQLDVSSTRALDKMKSYLADFHAHKHALVDEGFRNPPHFRGIPKLELMHNISFSIPIMGASNQYSTDTTEKLHPELKTAYRCSSRRNYEEQVCRNLDRGERLRCLELVQALDISDAVSATDVSNSCGTDQFLDFNADAVHPRLRNLPTFGKLTTRNRDPTNYFMSKMNRTFHTETTAFHLRKKFLRLKVDEAAIIYGIEHDFKTACLEFFRRSRYHEAHRYPSSSLYFEEIRTWPYVRIQTVSVQPHRKVNPSMQLQAGPPDNLWTYGRKDAFILKNYDPKLFREGPINLSKGNIISLCCHMNLTSH